MFDLTLLTLAIQRKESTNRSYVVNRTPFFVSFFSIIFIPCVGCKLSSPGKMYGLSKE